VHRQKQSLSPSFLYLSLSLLSFLHLSLPFLTQEKTVFSFFSFSTLPVLLACVVVMAAAESHAIEIQTRKEA
jgi:hypothetical protein